MSFIGELKRRNVFRVALFYLVSAWLVLQVAEILFEVLTVPDWALRMVFALLLLGFPIALVFSWVYEITPEGIRLEREVPADTSVAARTGHKLSIATVALLALAVALFAFVHLRNGVDLPQRAAPQDQAPAINSIAVLPFADMSPENNQAYLGDGIAEELLNLLSRVEGLKVAARTSSFKFRGEGADAREIGSALGVDTVLEGSVRKAGDRVRITAQLVGTRDGFHLWSQVFDRELDDVFEIQDEIARAITAALELELTGQAPRTELDAYELYLLGREHFHRRTAESLPRAIDLFKQVIDADPDYAPAWSGLADAYALIYQYGNYDAGRAVELAMDAARHAISLDPGLAEAHASLGLALGNSGDDVAAMASLQKAVELNPNYSMGWMWLGSAHQSMGQLDRALHAYQMARVADPLHPLVTQNVADALRAAGRYEEALTEYRTALERMPGQVLLQAPYTRTLIESGRLKEALAAAKRAQVLAPDHVYTLTALFFSNLALGRIEAAATHVRQLQDTAPQNPQTFLTRAELALSREDYEEALRVADEIDVPWAFAFIVHGLRARAYVFTERYEEALSELSQIAEGKRTGDPWVDLPIHGLRVIALRETGDEEAADAALAEGYAALQNFRDKGYAENALDHEEAMLHALAGETPRALAALERAYERGWRRSHGRSWLPILDRMIGGEPRYIQFKQRLAADIQQMREEVERSEGQGI